MNVVETAGPTRLQKINRVQLYKKIVAVIIPVRSWYRPLNTR